MVFAVVLLVFVGFAIAITFRPANIIALSLTVYAFEQWAQANSSFFGVHAAIHQLRIRDTLFVRHRLCRVAGAAIP